MHSMELDFCWPLALNAIVDYILGEIEIGSKSNQSDVHHPDWYQKVLVSRNLSKPGLFENLYICNPWVCECGQ